MIKIYKTKMNVINICKYKKPNKRIEKFQMNYKKIKQ